jgi:MFS transporter, SP family, galactose:H+ symporter
MKRSLRAALCASLGGIVVGVQLAVLSGLLELQSFTAALAATTSRKAALSSAYIAGAALFALPAAPLVDALGRRRALLVAAAASLAAAHVMATTTAFRTFLVARVAAGAVFAVLNIAVPIYLTEVAPTAARGQFVSLYQLAISIGIGVAQVANLQAALAEADGGIFRLVLSLAQVPSVVFAAAVFLAAPETPAWLAARGLAAELKKARAALEIGEESKQGACGSGSDIGEGEEVEGRVDGDVEAALLPAASGSDGSLGKVRSTRRGTSELRDGADLGYLALVLDPSARRRLFIAFGVQIGQQLTGVNCIIFFAPTILAPMFKATPYAAVGPFIAAVFIGSFNVAATLASLTVVERYGRKTLLLTMAVPMVLALVALAAVSISSAPPAAALVAILVYIASFALAWGPVPFLLSAEVFNVSMRGKGMTLSSLVMNLVSLALVTSFLHLHAWMGGSVFLLYAASTIGSAAFVWAFVPETRNVPLDRIDALLSKA